MSQLLRQRYSGTGNIDLVVPEIKPSAEWALVYVRCHFSRSAAGTPGDATFTIAVDHPGDDKFNVTLWSIDTVGDSADVNLRIDDHERSGWQFSAADQVRLAWTNPDTGFLWWGLEVGYEFSA